MSDISVHFSLLNDYPCTFISASTKGLKRNKFEQDMVIYTASHWRELTMTIFMLLHERKADI